MARFTLTDTQRIRLTDDNTGDTAITTKYGARAILTDWYRDLLDEEAGAGQTTREAVDELAAAIEGSDLSGSAPLSVSVDLVDEDALTDEEIARELYALAAAGGTWGEGPVTITLTSAAPREDAHRHTKATICTPDGREHTGHGYEGWVWLSPDAVTDDARALREAWDGLAAEWDMNTAEAEQTATRARAALIEHRRRERELAAAQDDAIRAWIATGATMYAIARKLGITQGAVRQIRDKAKAPTK